MLDLPPEIIVTASRAAVKLPTPESAAAALPVGSDLKLPDLTPFTTRRFLKAFCTPMTVSQPSPACGWGKGALERCVAAG